MKINSVQSVYNMRLNQSRENLFGRIKAKLIDSIFSFFRTENPLVETKIGNFQLKLPYSHELPFILKSFPYYSTNLARIAKQVAEKYPDLTFIDIGANVGDSVALLRTEAVFPILCIEGDDYFYSILRENLSKFKNTLATKVYVGDSTQEFNAVSIEVGGTAHLSQAKASGETIQLKKLSKILEEYPDFKTSKMLKVDTDGFDNKIIRGSVDFLEEAKPILFFEYDPFFLGQQNENSLSIFNTLSEIGYKKLLIYENNGEFLLSADVDNSTLLEDITHFYSGRNGSRYCDICAFHEEDISLFNKIRESEIKFFNQSRS